MIELEHSPLGGSAAHRFINCGFSFLEHRRQLAAKDFENITSEYADRGTGAHELGADCLQKGAEPYEYLGEEFNGFLVGWPNGIALDAVSIYVNHCRALMAANPESDVMIENTITLPHIHPLLKGTVDFGMATAHGVHLVDYKNGEGIGVPAPNNEQLLYYAFLLIMSDAWLRDPSQWDLPAELTIIQPNFYGLFEGPETWVTSIGYVIEWGQTVLLPAMNSLMSAPLEAHPEAIAGDWCQFCPVLLSCPKMQDAYALYSDAPEEYEVIMLSNAELDSYYAVRENARRFMKVLETTIHHRLVSGGDFESAKLVEKKVARIWAPGAQAALEKAFGAAAFAPKEIKSPAAIEKMSTQGKELAKEFGYKPASAGLSVAPLSDPRPAAKPRTNASVFAGHIPEEKAVDINGF